MRSLFREYFPLKDQEMDELWSEALVVLDANVILRLFRFEKKTSDEILEAFAKLGDQLWIPSQIAWEYNENRLGKINEAEKASTDLLNVFSSCYEIATSKLDEQKHFGVHPLVDLQIDIKELIEIIKSRSEDLKRKFNTHPTNDHYAELHLRIGDLFDGKVGADYSEEALKEIYAEGESRYSQKIPPGFEDRKKPIQIERKLYGDLIIWKQMIRKSLEAGKPIIFITEDIKEDWWEKEKGRAIGALPALKKEFYNNTSKQIYFYQLNRFLELAKTKNKVNLSAESVKEVNDDAEVQIQENIVNTRRKLYVSENDELSTFDRHRLALNSALTNSENPLRTAITSIQNNNNSLTNFDSSRNQLFSFKSSPELTAFCNATERLQITMNDAQNFLTKFSSSNHFQNNLGLNNQFINNTNNGITFPQSKSIFPIDNSSSTLFNSITGRPNTESFFKTTFPDENKEK